MSLSGLQGQSPVEVFSYGIFTARCYASVVLAMALSLSVSLSLRLSVRPSVRHKSVFY